MAGEELEVLWAFKQVNDTLIAGLESAVHTMENWDSLSQERRKSVIETIKKMIDQSKEVFEKVPTKH
jgi:hypothetical protein